MELNLACTDVSKFIYVSLLLTLIFMSAWISLCLLPALINEGREEVDSLSTAIESACDKLTK